MGQSLSCPHLPLGVVLFKLQRGLGISSHLWQTVFPLMLGSHSPVFPTATLAQFPAPPLNVVLMHSAHLDSAWKKNRSSQCKMKAKPGTVICANLFEFGCFFFTISCFFCSLHSGL